MRPIDKKIHSLYHHKDNKKIILRTIVISMCICIIKDALFFETVLWGYCILSCIANNKSLNRNFNVRLQRIYYTEHYDELLDATEEGIFNIDVLGLWKMN